MDAKDPTGVFTIEGNVAGPGALKMAQAREKQIAKFEKKKSDLAAKNRVPQLHNVDARFKKEVIGKSAKRHKQQIYGLKTREEFLQIKALSEQKEAHGVSSRKENKRKKREEKSRSRLKSKKLLLSFDDEEGEEIEIESVVHKDPTVKTSFLPDKERDAQQKTMESKLQAEWLALQHRIKKEKFEINLAYLDGAQHKYTFTAIKDDVIEDFLESARLLMIKDFPELTKHKGIDLMLVQDDVILPSSSSFYELMQLSSKTGPLMTFTSRENNVDKESSCNSIVCLRFWYERNKHIFPATKWQMFNEDNYEQDKTFLSHLHHR